MPDKKLENLDKDIPKESKIHLGDIGTPEDKVLEAALSMFDPEQEHVEGTPYTYTHVSLSEIRKQSQPGICFNWGAKGIGFGQITIVTRDGELCIDDECMSKEFIKEMFGHFIDEYYKKEGR